MRAAERVIGLEVFVVRICETPRSTTSIQSELPGVKFREANEEELLDAANDAALPIGDDFIRKAIARGDLAFAAFHESQMVAYVWRSIASAPHTADCWVRVAQPYCYSYNSFVIPEFRGKRLVPALIMFSDQEMLKRGFTHRAGIIATSNFASLAMGKSMNSQIVGRTGFWHFLGRYRFFRTRPVADMGFELYQLRSETSD